MRNLLGSSRQLVKVTAVVIVCLMATRCVQSQRVKMEAVAAAYHAACEGPPLGTPQNRNKAMEEGYEINREFDCIDKASFVAAAEQKAKWLAARTPEALAKKQLENDAAAAARKLQDYALASHQQDTGTGNEQEAVYAIPDDSYQGRSRRR